LGWRPQDYNYFSLSDFYNAWKGLDKVMQQHWQMARLTAFYAYAPHQGKGGNIKKPTDIFKLEIDEQQNGKKKELKFITVERIGEN